MSKWPLIEYLKCANCERRTTHTAGKGGRVFECTHCKTKREKP